MITELHKAMIALGKAASADFEARQLVLDLQVQVDDLISELLPINKDFWVSN